MPDLGPFVITGLALGAVYALSGVGLVVLYRTTGVVNFAYGATGALGALVAWSLIEDGVAQGVAWAAAVGVAVALTVAYGALLAPRLALRDESVNAAATVGLALLLLGFAGVAWADEPRSFSLPSDDASFRLFGVQVVATKAVALGLALAVTCAVGVALQRSRTGLALRAMAQDRELSGLVGIPVTRVGALAWALSGALSGLSGLLLADLVRLEAATLTFLVIPGIAAAVIGRLRSLTLTLIGGLAVGLAESLATPFASISSYRGTAPFVVAIVVLLIHQRRRGGVVVAVGR